MTPSPPITPPVPMSSAGRARVSRCRSGCYRRETPGHDGPLRVLSPGRRHRRRRADPRAAAAELDGFEQRLRTALASESVDDPVLRAVADTTRRFGVPEASLFDILDGVRMDLEPRSFETFHDLEEYCRRVASAVGIASIHVWGFLSPAALPAAHACGLAFQLTNILRNVAEDRGRGRLYLAA